MAPSATYATDETSVKIDFSAFHNVINGKLTSTSQTCHGINPATKKANVEVPVSTQHDLDSAVAAAKTAFKSWSRTSIEERKKKLLEFSAAVKAHREDFAQLLTREQGKPVSLSRLETDAACRFLSEIATLSLPEEVLEDSESRRVIVRHTPLGVVGAIVPWNFPVQLAAGKIAPALITGNVIIIKPSPFTPYSDLKLVELAQKFFPPGVVQALSGNDELGPWLTAHPGIDKISFTGSISTGKKVMESASKTLKRVTLELGGNDPAIICRSVNIPQIAPVIAIMALTNAGQICATIKRIYIHRDIYEDFRDAMVEHVKTLTVGDGMREDTAVGPVQNAMQYDRMQSFFKDIETQGQKVAVGGITPDSNGYFINPTIIDNPKDDSRLVVEEPFGPIMPLLKWSEEDEVIERANNTNMGLGGSVWTTDIAQGERMAKQIEAGTVWINSHMDVSPLFPFGGFKESGIGSEWGQNGLRSYCNVQTLHIPKTALGSGE